MAEALLLDWPSDDREEYVIAVKTCLDAFYGDRPVSEARAALVRAG